tara:strand:+ start:241 stop:408 length:168 start_codon:yes stop_codon:yes gene_type:complete
MSFGLIYEISWFGEVNATNGWGDGYPFDADGSHLTVDTIRITVDTTRYTADATQY